MPTRGGQVEKKEVKKVAPKAAAKKEDAPKKGEDKATTEAPIKKFPLETSVRKYRDWETDRKSVV